MVVHAFGGRFGHVLAILVSSLYPESATVPGLEVHSFDLNGNGNMVRYDQLSQRVKTKLAAAEFAVRAKRQSRYGVLCLLLTCLMALSVAYSQAIHSAFHLHLLGAVHTPAEHTQRPAPSEGQSSVTSDCTICALLHHTPGTTAYAVYWLPLVSPHERLWDPDTSRVSNRLEQCLQTRAPPVVHLPS
jgi:Protein of unknown function (DUF2946)